MVASMAAPAPATAVDAVVRSFDGTPIVTHFFGARAPAGTRSPTVMIGPGYARKGAEDPALDLPDAIGMRTLLEAGYNVLTWDPRGTGDSGGTVMFDSPDHEARDVQALLDHVARQPYALLDGPGDPRVGMSGYSYGGGIQLVSAAIDPRIDALVPDGAWHSLLTSFFRDGAVKAGWFNLLCAGAEGLGLVNHATPGPAGLQLGGTSGPIRRACLEGAGGGGVSAASRRFFADRGPGELVGRVRAPTLLLQASSDSLFPAGEAIANYDVLRANGVPVKMVWYCGGHGICLTGGGTPGSDRRRVARIALAWLDRWLKRDGSVDTGPRFEWISDDAVWRSGPDHPLAPAGTVDGVAAGLLGVTPGDSAGSGAVTYATPAVNAVDVRFAPPPDGSDLVGAPVVRLDYRGTAVPARTFLYAQVVDARARRVLGVQVTPIPVVLDGRQRSVTRALEPIAARGSRASDHRLQITPGTTVYGRQGSTGTVRLRVEASLPLVDATRSARDEPPAARTLPRRPRIAVSSRRLGGLARVVLRGRLRSRPCGGNMTFSLLAAGVRRAVTAPVSVTRCTARRVVRLRVAPGRRLRVGARFEGNGALLGRRARAVLRVLR